jgi:hypothetical protein
MMKNKKCSHNILAISICGKYYEKLLFNFVGNNV